MVCLILLILTGIQFIIKGGDDFREVPASSIFCEREMEDELSGVRGGPREQVLIQGQVYKKSNTSKNQILYLKNNSITYQEQNYFESKIIIYDKSFINIPIGKTIQMCGVIAPFEQARNPGNFDQRDYYAKQRIYGYGYLERIVEIAGNENIFMEKLYQLRRQWKSILYQHLGEKNGAILSAMLLAEKSELDFEVKELYQKNGISHILAISGLHISFIGMGVYQILRKRAKLGYEVSGSIAVLILGMYVLMIGFSVSVFRAFLMLFLRIGAEVTGRVYDILTALMLSAAILVIHQPLYLKDAAFLMSHGAILGIVVVLPRLRECCNKVENGKWSKLLDGMLSSAAVNLVLLPVLLCFYYEIPLYSILLNVIVIPLMSVVLSCGMFGSILGLCVPVVGKLLLGICGCVFAFFELLSKLCEALPFHRIVLGKPEWWQIAIYYGILVLWLWRKHWRLVVMLCTCLVFMKLSDGKLHITMLDVGQGDSIYLKGPKGMHYLVDGGSSDVKQVGKYRIEPYLKSQGVGELEYVFVSHGDADHCNGILEMLERQDTGVKIQNLVLGTNYQNDEVLVKMASVALEHGVQVNVMTAGKTIWEGDMSLSCLQPSDEEDDLAGNAGSMILEIQCQDFEMILTGDVEGSGEELLRQKIKKSYDVLKVAHHGSKNSTMEEFLKVVKPKLALISAGAENAYGHPHKEVLERLEDVGCKVLETEKSGAIMLEVGEEIKVGRWLN